MGWWSRRAAQVSSSLKAKLVLLIVAILALAIGAAPWGEISLQEWQLLQVYEQELRAFAEMFRNAVVVACMITQRREAVQGILEEIGRRPYFRAVRIFDTAGVIGYSAHREERGQKLGERVLARYVGHPDPIVETDGEGAIYTLVQPMFNTQDCVSCHPADRKVLGILQVSLSLDPMRAQIGSLRRSASLATVVALVLVAAGVWLSLSFLVDEPLQGLVKVMEEAKGGNLAARAPVASEDELGQLAAHFNDMISRLEKANREIERYHQEQLARADRLATIGEMAAGMAHEIRNPLTGIAGALSVLSRGFRADDPRQEVVRETRLLIDRLNRSVESILHYARPVPPQFQSVQLDAVVASVLPLAESEARKAAVRLRCEPEKSTAVGAAPLLVWADPHQLQQVLLNLVLNAIQATPVGGEIAVRTHMCLQGEQGSGCACLEVEDTGKGMSESEVAKAFQPFFSTKPGGTGLGLPIAKQIIEQHGGRISIASTPGKGTRVRIELPHQNPEGG